MKWAVVGILLASLLVGFAGWQMGQRDAPVVTKPEPTARVSIVGVYVQDISGPVAAKMRLEIHGDGRWVMANMLSGYWGTWKARGAAFDLLNTEGPAGKIKTPTHLVVELLPNRDLKMRGKGNSITFLRQSDSSPFLVPIDPNKPQQSPSTPSNH